VYVTYVTSVVTVWTFVSVVRITSCENSLEIFGVFKRWSIREREWNIRTVVVVAVVTGTTTVLVVAGGAEVIRQVHAALILLAGFGFNHGGRGDLRLNLFAGSAQPA
jgi:hypothetical protein